MENRGRFGAQRDLCGKRRVNWKGGMHLHFDRLALQLARDIHQNPNISENIVISPAIRIQRRPAGRNTHRNVVARHTQNHIRRKSRKPVDNVQILPVAGSAPTGRASVFHRRPMFHAAPALSEGLDAPPLQGHILPLVGNACIEHRSQRGKPHQQEQHWYRQAAAPPKPAFPPGRFAKSIPSHILNRLFLRALHCKAQNLQLRRTSIYWAAPAFSEIENRTGVPVLFSIRFAY